jgi:UrcA family protein
MTKYLSKPRMKCALLAAGLLAGSAMFMSGSAGAAQDEEITVLAPRTIHREVVGHTAIGAPIEQVSLSRRVSYYGLDLRRPSDMNELERRIKMTANEACDQLKQLYPLDAATPSDQDCKTSAYNNGMEQVHMIVGSR